jgi:hypothetical protein
MKNSLSIITREILRYFYHLGVQSLNKIGQLPNRQFFSCVLRRFLNRIVFESNRNRIKSKGFVPCQSKIESNRNQFDLTALFSAELLKTPSNFRENVNVTNTLRSRAVASLVIRFTYNVK